MKKSWKQNYFFSIQVLRFSTDMILVGSLFNCHGVACFDYPHVRRIDMEVMVRLMKHQAVQPVIAAS